MSRVGKKPINIPDKIQIDIQDDHISIKGPLGEQKVTMYPEISVVKKDQSLLVTRSNDLPATRSKHGLVNRLIGNAIIGCTTGYQKEMELIGVGYKVALKGKNLELFIGFSHPVIFTPPAGIQIKVEKNNITVSGFDKQLVGETAAQIRDLKPPEPYKGKGIKYIDEHIRRKSGKMAAASSSS